MEPFRHIQEQLCPTNHRLADASRGVVSGSG
jgi:hypothetical protein